MDPDLEQRWKSFQKKAMEDTAQVECKNLCCVTFNNTDDTCTESDVHKYCNFASLKLVFKIHKAAIQEFILNSKNGSTASKKENMVAGSVGSYIASLNKTLEAHFIGKMDVNTFMQKYPIGQFIQFLHEQLSKPKRTTPSAMNSNLKGPLQKFYLFIKDEYYNKSCKVKDCNCKSQQHRREVITICENCGCGCCNNLNQHSCHDTEGNCRGKLQCKEPGCMQYYPYCLFSKFFSIPNNVLHTTYTSYQCDVCAYRKTARKNLDRRNKRHLAPKAGPGPVWTVLEQMKRFDCVTVKRKFERRISQLPDRWNGNSSTIEEEQIEVQVLQKKEIKFFEGFLHFHALVKCTDDRFRYKPGDIVTVHTNMSLRRRGLDKKIFQILNGEYNANRHTCDYQVNGVTDERDHDNNIERREIILSHEDIKGFYVEEKEIISITSSHEKTFTINTAHKTDIVKTFNDLSANLNFENLNYAFDKPIDTLISEGENLNNMLYYMKQLMRKELKNEENTLSLWEEKLYTDDNGLEEDVISYYNNKFKLKGVLNNFGHLQVRKERRETGSKKESLSKKNDRHRGNKQTNVETSGSRGYVSSDEDDDELIIDNVEDAQKVSEPNNDYYIDLNKEMDFYSEGETENQKADSSGQKQKTHFINVNGTPVSDEDSDDIEGSEVDEEDFI